MPKKKTEIIEIRLNHGYMNNGYKFIFTRFDEDGNIAVDATTSTGQWYIKIVSIEDIRTLLDIDPKVKIVIKED